MTVPGSNLLKRAFKLIAQQTFDYYSFVSRTPNAIGYLNATYADPVTLKGSVQPVPRRLYEAMGLDFQKDYVTLYIPKDAIDVARNVSGDYFVYGAQKFQCESKTNWFRQDGWDAILAVMVQS